MRRSKASGETHTHAHAHHSQMQLVSESRRASRVSIAALRETLYAAAVSGQRLWLWLVVAQAVWSVRMVQAIWEAVSNMRSCRRTLLGGSRAARRPVRLLECGTLFWLLCLTCQCIHSNSIGYVALRHSAWP